ncbi:MAG: hypothetical protein ACRCTD_14670, partial [Beijerinckiaceae bacterium]
MTGVVMKTNPKVTIARAASRIADHREYIEQCNMFSHSRLRQSCHHQSKSNGTAFHNHTPVGVGSSWQHGNLHTDNMRLSAWPLREISLIQRLLNRVDDKLRRRIQDELST